jgi:hypothetical protein
MSIVKGPTVSRVAIIPHAKHDAVRATTSAAIRNGASMADVASVEASLNAASGGKLNMFDAGALMRLQRLAAK